ncbi:MAG: HAD family hydrolase [Deltaproteobacteria bacterium]|nr:HAD family hydrolase [Deltaproteobacteria bacterium]
MKKPAVFLDRDGTINEEMGYINHLSRFKILPGVAEAIRLLNNNNLLAIVLSNQSGVARGYFPIELVDEIHAYLNNYLKERNAHIDGIFFCPHYPNGPVVEYGYICDCRKPKTGLIDQALKTFEIDMSRSYMVGDRWTDLEFADRLNLKPILVKTGYGLGDMQYILPQKNLTPGYIAEDLLDAVHWILEKEKHTKNNKTE